LGLHPCHGVENHYPTIQHTQAALNFSSEIDMTGRIYDVNLAISPEAGHHRSGDSDSPLPLLLHPIRNGRPIVHIAHAVGATRVEENPLGRRSLARINVRDDANIPYELEGMGTGHVSASINDQWNK
jgi:hypothetical protein